MKKESRFILSFSKEEIANSNIKALIRELINLKLNLQRYKDFLTISPAEFEIISKLGEFVDKEKYNRQIIFKGEVGKIKGKRIVVQ
jgi:hypothetical protein